MDFGQYRAMTEIQAKLCLFTTLECLCICWLESVSLKSNSFRSRIFVFDKESADQGCDGVCSYWGLILLGLGFDSAGVWLWWGLVLLEFVASLSLVTDHRFLVVLGFGLIDRYGWRGTYGGQRKGSNSRCRDCPKEGKENCP